MHPLVWDVVCLAAVVALGLGLRLLFRVQAGAPGGRMPVVRVCAVVTADFWARLSAFAELGLAPRGWGYGAWGPRFAGSRSRVSLLAWCRWFVFSGRACAPARALSWACCLLRVLVFGCLRLLPLPGR